MSNLPPGVTPKMIDDLDGPAGDRWSGGLYCEHDDARDEAWEAADAADRDPERDDAYLALCAAPTEFTDAQVSVGVYVSSGLITVVWDCPVCGASHEDEHDPDDFRDD